MKTAISIPAPVFRAAERTARRLGMSRSEFYARAVDAVYAAEPSEIDPLLRTMQEASLPREDW